MPLQPEGDMSVTQVAIWGAVTGSAALLIQLLTFWRDRPHLRVLVDGMLTYGLFDLAIPVPGFYFSIANLGRQPITIMSIGMEAVRAKRGLSRPALVGEIHLGTESGVNWPAPALVKPGEVFRASMFTGDGVPERAQQDGAEELRPRVTDARGRDILGEAFPIEQVIRSRSPEEPKPEPGELGDGWEPVSAVTRRGRILRLRSQLERRRYG